MKIKTFTIEIPVEDYASLMIWLGKKEEAHDLLDEHYLADHYSDQRLSVQRQQRNMG
jgi:hypothetical protein